MISIEELIARSKMESVEVHVPELNDSILVRLLKKREIDDIRFESMDNGTLNEDKFARLVVIRGCAAPALNDANIESITGGNYKHFNAIFTVIAGENGLLPGYRQDARKQFQA